MIFSRPYKFQSAENLTPVSDPRPATGFILQEEPSVKMSKMTLKMTDFYCFRPKNNPKNDDFRPSSNF